MSVIKNKSLPSWSLHISIGDRKMNKVWVQPSQGMWVFKVLAALIFRIRLKLSLYFIDKGESLELLSKGNDLCKEIF